jgi:hypothetical protein
MLHQHQNLAHYKTPWTCPHMWNEISNISEDEAAQIKTILLLAGFCWLDREEGKKG